MSTSRVRDLARAQLDRRLDQIRSAIPALRCPQGGWINGLRTALGMTQADLAHRIGISRQAVSQMEQRESDGSVTLRALEKAAQALDSQLVYAIVPVRPIGQMLEERVLRRARQMMDSVRHTMRLEDQEPDSDLEERTMELAKELLAAPTRLWSESDG